MGGWQDYAVITPGQGVTGVTKVPDGVTPEMMLSVIGLTGMTAYFGLLELGQPKAGETVLVSGAAGATGSVASQIAKIKGCRVVGIAGGPEKCRWLTQVAGLAAAIDYKQGNLDEQIAAACPDKWDVFFDNVGGETLDAVLARLNEHARLPICGQISEYDVMNSADQYGIRNFPNLLRKHAPVTGFSVRESMDMFEEFVLRMAALMKSGDVVYTEDIVDGIENAPDAFIGRSSGFLFTTRIIT